MIKNAKTKFIVAFEIPVEATILDAEEYIKDAIKSYCGGLFTGDYDEEADPMYYLNKESVEVSVFGINK